MAEPRLGELQAIALDAGAAQRELGWSVQWQIEDGLAQTVDWLRSNLSEASRRGQSRSGRMTRA